MKKVQTGYVVEFYTNTCLVNVKGELIPCFAIKNVVVGDKVTIEKVDDSKGKKAIIVSREKRLSALSRKAKQKIKPLQQILLILVFWLHANQKHQQNSLISGFLLRFYQKLIHLLLLIKLI